MSFVKRCPCRHVLTRCAANGTRYLSWTCARVVNLVIRGLDLRKLKLLSIPAVHLGDVFYTTFQKPSFVSKRGEELNIRVLFLDFQNGRVGKMVVVSVRDDDSVDYWDIFNVTWRLCVTSWS